MTPRRWCRTHARTLVYGVRWSTKMAATDTVRPLIRASVRPSSRPLVQLLLLLPVLFFFHLQPYCRLNRPTVGSLVCGLCMSECHLVSEWPGILTPLTTLIHFKQIKHSILLHYEYYLLWTTLDALIDFVECYWVLLLLLILLRLNAAHAHTHTQTHSLTRDIVERTYTLYERTNERKKEKERERERRCSRRWHAVNATTTI